MALIKCPECGREVSDSASQCPNCGFGVSKFVHRQKRIVEIQQETEKEAYLYVKRRKQKQEEQKKLAEKAEESRKNNIYQQAINKYESQSSRNIEEAEGLFLSIAGWKDSDEYYNKCKIRFEEVKKQEDIRKVESKKRKNKIMVISAGGTLILFAVAMVYIFAISPKVNYKKGLQALESGAYYQAYDYFSKADINEEELIEYGINAIEKGDIQKGYTAIQCVGENANTLDEVQKAYYEKACEYVKNSQFEKIDECFTKIEKNELKRKFDELCYSYAIKYYESLDYVKAYELFERLDASEFEISQYMENSKSMKEIYESLEIGELSLYQLEKIEELKVYDSLSDDNKKIIKAMKESLNAIQGCFKGGRPYYFYITGMKMYWGDETGCFQIDAIFIAESKSWYTGYGEDILGISNNGLKTTLRTYERVSSNELPNTFSSFFLKK